eukprot:COSAG04_NODE_11942_length_679_cov_1.446552_2_plen_76_part_01
MALLALRLPLLLLLPRATGYMHRVGVRGGGGTDGGQQGWELTFEDEFDGDALDPIPNAIVMNWATIFVLGFGNLMA